MERSHPIPRNGQNAICEFFLPRFTMRITPIREPSI